MNMDLVSYIAIGAGVAVLLTGSVVKYITKGKVEDLEGFVGIIDRTEPESEDDEKDQRSDTGN